MRASIAHFIPSLFFVFGECALFFLPTPVSLFAMPHYTLKNVILNTFVLGLQNMRIWDISCEKLCRVHLLGEHRELHAIWVVLTMDKKGYSKHPETKRWVGKLAALYERHEEEVKEMEKRGYVHKSSLDKDLAMGSSLQDVFINSMKEQEELLRNKNCECFVD